MHACPGLPGETAAAMVAHLRSGNPRELTATVWTAFGSPCLSLFRPVYPFAVGLPAVLDIGASTFSGDSPWWVFERLQRTVAVEPALAAHVRESFAPVQQRFYDMAADAERRAETALADGNRDAAISILRNVVDATTAEAIQVASSLQNELDTRVDTNPIPEMASFWAEIDERAGVPGIRQTAIAANTM
jgi:dipeptidase